jgi:hypothetical protein
VSETRKIAAKKPGRENARKEDRVRCSSLVDWPVYPRLRRIMWGAERVRNFQSRSRAGLASYAGNWVTV